MNPQKTNLLHDDAWDDASFNLFDLLSFLALRHRLLSSAAAAGAIVGAIIAFFLPNTYSATAVIIPPQKEQSSASMLIGQLGPLAAAAGADIGLKNPGDLYIGLLGSRTIADRLIQQFRLNAVYRTEKAADARAELKRHSRFSSGRDSLIRVEVDDVDPKRAADIANAYVSELNSQNRRLAISEASQRRAFLENQLADEKAALAQAENSMKETQQKTGVIDVSGQTQVAIASLAQLRAQITSAEVSLERMKMGATPLNPEILQKETELAEMRSQLRKLEKSPGTGGALLPASAMPGAGLDYVRRLRDLKYHEFLYELLSKQYEAARMDETKAAPSLQIVDPAIPPDKKSGPARSLIVVLCGLVAAFGAALSAYLRYIHKVRALRVPSAVQRTSTPEACQVLNQPSSRPHD